MIKDVLTVVDNAESSGAFLKRFAAALDRSGAHGTVTILTPAPMIATSLAPFGSVYLPDYELRRDASIAIDAIKVAFEGGGQDIEVDGCYGDVGWLAHGLKARTALADLVVIAAEDSWSVPWLRRRVVETLLLAGGMPMLLLPPGGEVPAIRTALFGWKPSGEARQALRDLIQLAEPGAKIEIATIADDAAAADDGLLNDHLRRHGLKPSRTALVEVGSTSETLLAAALEIDADVLAIGGFAHSRVREIMLGGVTRSLIGDPRLPILISH